MKTAKAIVILLVVLFLIPFTSWVFWSVSHSRKLNVLVMNKTVLGLDNKEQKAIFWVLLNEKFVKNNGKRYRIDKDYYGFHPIKPLKSRKYEVKRIRLNQVQDLANEYDATYYCDTYGVFFNEWYRREASKGKGTLIEGGLNNSDYAFLMEMSERHRLVIAEYNFLAPPTIGLVRKKAEDMLGLTWTNWTGSYIRDLDPVKSKDLPGWIVGIYKKRHNGEWPFSGSGIIFVNELAQQVAVLEADKHLEINVPEIQTTDFGLEHYKLPETVHYPGWFDIIDPGTNQILADYKIHVSIEGKAILDEFGIPSRFPAVIESSSDAPYFYLAGNYSNYPVPIWDARLKGIRTFKHLFCSKKEYSASQFYWYFYVPLVSQILTDYQAGLEK